MPSFKISPRFDFGRGFARISKNLRSFLVTLSDAFDETTGHGHDGSTGEGKPLGAAWASAEVTLTSAQVKALKATPIVLVAAPAANLAIVPIAINLVVNYGGTNVFTESADDLSIGYSAGAEIKEIESTGLIDQAVDEWRFITFEHAETFIPEEATAVVITNLDDEIAGNAGADNTVKVKIYYLTVDTDA